MTFLNATLLFGLAAVAVPVAIHFLSRTKYVEVDWGAMRFLTPSPRTRRRKRFDHLLLLLLRGGVLALLAFALAAPTVPGTAWPSFTRGGTCDVVLLIDNSASTAGPAADAIKQWAKAYLAGRGEADRVAVFSVRRSLNPLAPAWSSPTAASSRLELLSPPAGTADWPAAVALAVGTFDDPTRERHVVCVGDGQRYGLADESARARWPLAVPAGESPPRVWFVGVPVNRTAGSGVDIEPIATARGVIVAGREVAFTTTVRATGPMPSTINVEWDGRPAGTVPVAADGRVRVMRRFAAGSHVLTLRTANDRQDRAFEVVPAVPVLVLDGDPKGEGRGAKLLKAALAPEKDPAPGFAVRIAPAGSFGPVTLKDDVAGPGTPPRVVMLANVASLTAEQSRAVETYLQSGGGVLVLPGDRVEAARWNAVSLRGGQGWLPARFDKPFASEDAKPRPGASSHPALAAFKEPLPGGLHAAVFPTYWKLDPTVSGPGTTVACSLTTGDPFLIDRGVGAGRVILAAVPFDSSWESGFPGMPDYVRLIHELTYALAATGTGDRDLAAGTPITLTPKPDEPPAGVTVAAPEAAPKVVPVSKWPLSFAETHVPGVYAFTTAAGRTTYFAVRADPRERDATTLDDADREALANAGFVLVNEPREIDSTRPVTGGPAPRREIWWWVMLGVLVHCVGEWWLAGRAEKGSG